MAGQGWDQPPALFALVEREQLIAENPDMADSLGEGFYIPVYQDDMPDDRALEEVIGDIVWPEKVSGCAVSMERVMLPPDVELPEDDGELQAFAAEHPKRSEVRIVAAVDRAGTAHSAVRARYPDDAQLLEGPDLVPGLVSALQGTLAD